MSAVNIICQPAFGTIQIVTDAASYDENGLVTAFSPKIFAVPQWPGAITGRGSVDALNKVKDALGECATLDDAIEVAGNAMRNVARPGENFELFLTGFTSRKVPEIWFTRSEGGPTAFGYPEPFQPMEFPFIVVLPHVPFEFAGINEPAEITTKLRNILEMQRLALHGDSTWHSIGGHGQYMKITRERIEQRILQRWTEDRVGELIRPNLVES